MKKNIHPQYYTDAKITCSCGATLTVGSTQKSMQIEVCSQCHPFYTGEKKTVDTTGRVDRFKKLTEKADEKKEARKSVKSKEEKRKARKAKAEQKTVVSKKKLKDAAKKEVLKKKPPKKK